MPGEVMLPDHWEVNPLIGAVIQGIIPSLLGLYELNGLPSSQGVINTYGISARLRADAFDTGILTITLEDDNYDDISHILSITFARETDQDPYRAIEIEPRSILTDLNLAGDVAAIISDYTEQFEAAQQLALEEAQDEARRENALEDVLLSTQRESFSRSKDKRLLHKATAIL